MQIRMRLFARQRELAGARQVEVEVPDGGLVESAWEALVAVCPAVGSSKPYVRFAVNGEWAGLEAPLADGDEVACIPPVSGGSGDADGDALRVRDLRISPDPIDDAVLRSLEAAVLTPADGAVVLFVGRTRVTPGTPAPGEEADAERHAGREVLALEYEAYDAMALRIFGEIANEVESRFGVRRLAIVHRVGTVPLGDASVAIAVAAPHRGVAFLACEYAIDELKARAPIWKSERFADGTVWIGEPVRTTPRED